ncbi:4-hydroxy-tetrahydrodipicolinate reductase [Clostridium punense]|uniref:4-hydroxy-tetrahydrodipicolinate reductase n=1 Tax=Clostridium punense TaxID=1054297 RepID=A0ABS4K3W0_9CLOT|nr:MULTISPECIES: 4-hydroxy-tetrahydrodipicolinate reductase [Clostridium]EQB90177.1 hypothetical protein M918_01455 [Clostridium sp. BL8]MBP2021936.1 4-hydroxy-tetrahydrodipicolinate reductase [Clostridium punense]
MIKVLLVGCNGKMGKMISSTIEKFEDITIAAGVDRYTESSFGYPVFSSILDCDKEIDVILDFSRPDAFEEISGYAIKNNKAVIFCTTGYSLEQVTMIKALKEYIPVFYSANMSIGVNIVNNLLKNLSNILYKDFDIEIIEKHHNQKVDAPSGTALLLANTIKNSIEEETLLVHGREGISKRHHKEIGVHAIRGGNIIGDHEVIFAGQGEVIEIKHSAISREVFAVGAIKACLFIYGKEKGLYSMEDVVRI